MAYVNICELCKKDMDTWREVYFKGRDREICTNCFETLDPDMLYQEMVNKVRKEIRG